MGPASRFRNTSVTTRATDESTTHASETMDCASRGGAYPGWVEWSARVTRRVLSP